MWEYLLLLHNKVLFCLEAIGFTVNPFKCEWTIKATNWLGSWLMPTSLKPWNKCISAILEQDPPCILKEMRSFLGALNAYQLMWPKHAHLLKPLSDESGKKTFHWTPETDKVFKHMRAGLAADVLWHTVTITFLFIFTLTPLTTKWVLSLSNKSSLLLIVLKS